MPIKTILVPTDFSENAQAAFDVAYELAASLQARLHVLHVQDESSMRVALKEGLLESTATDEELQAEIHKITEMRFSSLMAGANRTDVEMETLTRRGDADAEIVRCAKDLQADMLVIGMRGLTAWSALTNLVLGSVAESVLKNSPCPTLMVKLPTAE